MAPKTTVLLLLLCSTASLERSQRAKDLRWNASSEWEAGWGGGGGGAGWEPRWWGLIRLEGGAERRREGWRPLLERRQAAMVSRDGALASVLGRALRAAAAQCQAFFGGPDWEAWKSHSPYSAPAAPAPPQAMPSSVFGRNSAKACRETAFLYAVISAAAVREVAKACARGELRLCSCDGRRRGRSGDGWSWAGCSDNLPYGLRLTRRFLDRALGPSFRPSRLRALMDSHNSEAGRVHARSSASTQCVCRGDFASCARKSCSRHLGPLRSIAASLYARLHSAARLSPASRPRQGRLRKGRRRRALVLGPSRRDLVYLDESPDLCQASKGRSCVAPNGTSSVGSVGSGSVGVGPGPRCSEVCCAGWYQRPTATRERCRCSFRWCCEVHCQQCTILKPRFFCL